MLVMVRGWKGPWRTFVVRRVVRKGGDGAESVILWDLRG